MIGEVLKERAEEQYIVKASSGHKSKDQLVAGVRVALNMSVKHDYAYDYADLAAGG